MKYRVVCSAASFENTETDDLDRATDLCYDLAQEYGQCEIRQYNWDSSFHTVMDYDTY